MNNKAAVVADRGGATNYYAKDGTVPYQMYYPRTGGYWPPTRFRLLWIWFFGCGATGTSRPRQSSRRPKSGAAACTCLACGDLFSSGPGAMYTRWCVPVEESLTRVVYFRSRRVRTP